MIIFNQFDQGIFSCIFEKKWLVISSYFMVFIHKIGPLNFRMEFSFLDHCVYPGHCKSLRQALPLLTATQEMQYRVSMIQMFSGFFLRNELAILGRTLIIFAKKYVLDILKNVSVTKECFKISLQILEFTTQTFFLLTV